MSTKLPTLTPNLFSFQVIDSKSGNICIPPFRKEGNEITFGFRFLENGLLEVKTTSITFFKSLFYELVSRAKYVVDSAYMLGELNEDELVNTGTLLAQHCLKRHLHIFRQFNSAGTFKSCSIDEMSFEELRLVVSETILSIKEGSEISVV
jgi:hypothetical protein